MVKCGACAWVEELLKIIQIALIKSNSTGNSTDVNSTATSNIICVK